MLKDFIEKLPVQNLIAILIFVIVYFGYQVLKELKQVNQQLIEYFRPELERRHRQWEFDNRFTGPIEGKRARDEEQES